jgi:hypothetical protein
MKTWNLEPPVTMDELLQADVRCNWWTHSKGFDWRYLGDVAIDRARRVMIEGQTPKQVAESDGITRQHVYVGLKRAMRAVSKLRRGECRKVGADETAHNVGGNRQ